MASREVRVPDLGGAGGVTVSEVLVKAGDEVTEGQGLLVLESDKASMEVPSPAAGKVESVAVKAGDEISEGTVVATLEGAAEEAPATPAAAAPAATAPAPESSPPRPPSPSPPSPPPGRGGRTETEEAEEAEEPEVDEEAFALAYAGPGVRLYARELGVDLGRVAGTGRKGRILKEDVQGFVKAAVAGAGVPAAAAAPAGGGVAGFTWPAMPAIDFAKFGEVEVVELSRIRRASARNLHRSWLHVPHVTQHEDADVTELEAFREAQGEEAKKRGFKLTPIAFLLKAAAAALRDYPDVNASLDPSGEKLVRKKYFHVGVAVDTPDGLVVPVVRDVDKKGILALAAEVVALSAKARDGKLAPGDYLGATFTITSLGGIGGTAFTPIVNAPEVAILGASRTQVRPVWDAAKGAFAPRKILPLSLSYDHRVVDGALGCRFLVHLAGLLTDVRRLLL